MDWSVIAPAITAAMSVGLGCGACCSPVISMFLSSYVVSHADGVKTGLWSFISFFLGKIISVIFLCCIAAGIGRQFIGIDGYIGSFNLRGAVRILMSGIGVVMVIRWFTENVWKKTCHKCHNRESGGQKNSIRGVLPIFWTGLTYGITPCAPLLIILGYAFTLPVLSAGITGCVFGLSSAASPVLLLALISGTLSKRLAKEIPHCIKWFRLVSYVLLIFMPFFVRL